MVRSTRILEIMEKDGLIGNAATTGTQLRAGLEDLAARHPTVVTNARGRGLMCAMDLPGPDERDLAVTRLREDAHVLVLACGQRSICFRPPLTGRPAEGALAPT